LLYEALRECALGKEIILNGITNNGIANGLVANIPTRIALVLTQGSNTLKNGLAKSYN